MTEPYYSLLYTTMMKSEIKVMKILEFQAT